MENATETALNLNESLQKVTQVTEDFHLVLWAIIDTILMIAIIGENILTICALRISRKLTNLISNHFICSLAFSDLMVGLMLPYHLAFYITDELGRCKYTCLLRFVMIVFACCASIYNLLAIAFDRYIAIVHPLHYNRFMTRRMVFSIIGIGWFCAISLAACLTYWNDWTGSMDQKCEMFHILPKNYIVFVLTPSFASIWVAVLMLYWRIWKEAREHTKRMKSVSHTNGTTNNDWKSVQVVMLILGCFSICWLPYFIVIITIKLLQLEGTLLYEPAFTLAMANSGINPAIYAWKNKGFRRAFVRLLTCKNPNLGENHFSYNYSKKIPKPVPDSDKIVNGICNGTEQCVLQSELGTANGNNKIVPYDNNDNKTVINNIHVKQADDKMINGNCDTDDNLINGNCETVDVDLKENENTQ